MPTNTYSGPGVTSSGLTYDQDTLNKIRANEAYAKETGTPNYGLTESQYLSSLKKSNVDTSGTPEQTSARAIDTARAKAGLAPAETSAEWKKNIGDYYNKVSQPVVTTDKARDQYSTNANTLAQMTTDRMASMAQQPTTTGQITPTTKLSPAEQQLKDLSATDEDPLRAMYEQKIVNAEKMIDTQIRQYESFFNQQKSLGQANYSTNIANIQGMMDERREETRTANQEALSTQVGAGIRTGRQRYAPEIQAGILNAQEQAGISLLRKIDAEESRLITEAQIAASEKDMAALDSYMQNITQLTNQKLAVSNDLTQLMLQEQESRAQQKQQDIENQMKFMEMEEARAGQLASVIGGQELSDDQINSIAQQYGVDSLTLRAKIAQSAPTAADQMDLMYKEAQLNKLLAETGQIYNESGFTDGMFTPEASSWANLIYSGKAKLNEVPSEIRTQVANALNSMPPKPEDLTKITDKINTLDSLINSPGLNSAVGPTFLTRGNKLNWKDAFTGSTSNFIGELQSLLSQEVLDKLIQSKSEGATFGALSEGELRLLQESASKINKWALKDKNGAVIGYDISETEMKKELEKIKTSYQLLKKDSQIDASLGSLNQFQSTNYNYSPQTTTSPFNQVGGDTKAATFNPQMSKQVFGTVANRYQEGSVGGQCGDYVRKVATNMGFTYPRLGDSLTSKMNAVKNYGTSLNNAGIGSVIVTRENPTYGHVAYIIGRNANGWIVSESNFKQSNKVSHGRVIPFNSPKVVGVINPTRKA